MRAYYNDIDPFCCAVLRKNIQAGNLPRGDVDERDIRDVRAEQLMGYGAVHLFAGIGGFPLGFAWAGVPSEWRLLTGGFPCTDISNAGKRAGISGEQSGLWKEMERLISECADCDSRFDFVVVENVAALASRGLDTVLVDLAKVGYDAQWACLRASDFGAPHIRERLFLLAYPTRQQGRGLFQSRIPANADASHPALANAASRQLHGSGAAWRGRAGLANGGETVADADWQRREECNAPTLASQPCHTARRTSAPGSVADSTSARRQSRAYTTGLRAEPDASGAGNAQPGLGRVADGVPCWLDEYRWPASPGQAQFEWEPLRVTSERVANRVAQLRAYGNAIVPQVAAEVGCWLLDIAAWLESEATR